MKNYTGKLTKDGLPDRRTAAGRAWFKRSEAAKKGWETRRLKEREKRDEWPIGDEYGEIIVEEPIDEVGGASYRKSRVFLGS